MESSSERQENNRLNYQNSTALKIFINKNHSKNSGADNVYN